jgi:class 3 adenylate cyclase
LPVKWHEAAYAGWLDGMSEYSQRFAENRIDLSDLHLKDLGDRLKMLRAIPDSEKGSVPPQTASRSNDTAERRQVTVMFSNVVDSTAPSARIDPEDVRDVIAAHHKCATAIVQVCLLARLLGDGVRVAFWRPEGSERTALAYPVGGL